MKLPPQLEKDFQADVVKFLTLEGFEAFEFAKSGTHKKLGGVVPDHWPDVVAFQAGKTLALECKAGNRKATLGQKLMLERLAAQGVYTGVVRTLEGVAKRVEAMGFELRHCVATSS